MLVRRTCRCRRRGRPIARSPTAYPAHRRRSARTGRCGARTCAPSGPASRSTRSPPSTTRWTPTCASDPVPGRVRDLPVELDAVDRAIGPEIDLPPLVVRVRRRPARGGVAVVALGLAPGRCFRARRTRRPVERQIIRPRGRGRHQQAADDGEEQGREPAATGAPGSKRWVDVILLIGRARWRANPLTGITACLTPAGAGAMVRADARSERCIRFLQGRELTSQVAIPPRRRPWRHRPEPSGIRPSIAARFDSSTTPADQTRPLPATSRPWPRVIYPVTARRTSRRGVGGSGHAMHGQRRGGRPSMAHGPTAVFMSLWISEAVSVAVVDPQVVEGAPVELPGIGIGADSQSVAARRDGRGERLAC